MKIKRPTNMPFLRSVALALALLVTALRIQAQDAGIPKQTPKVDTGGHMEMIAIESEPGLKPFLEAYIAASNARDMEKLKAMNHPKDLEALKEFFASHKPVSFKGTFESTLLREPIPESHPPFIVQRYLKDSPLPQAGWMEWPAPPTHEVQFTIETATGPNSSDSHSVLIELVHEGTRWFAVHGVPGPKTLEMFKGK